MKLIVHHHLIDRLAFFNGLISGIALYPQVYSIFLTGSTAGVSLTTFIIVFINSIVWLFYAVHRQLFSLGLASMLNLIASGLLIFLILFSNYIF